MCSKKRTNRCSRVVAAVPPVLSWSYYLAMPYTGALGLLGLGTTAWFLSTAGLMLGIELVQLWFLPGRDASPGPGP